MCKVKVISLTSFGAVAEHGADGAGVFDFADRTVGILGTGEVLILCAGSDGGAGSGAGWTVGVGLAGEAGREGTLALNSAEWFAVFHACVIDALFGTIAPIDHDLAQRHLVMRGPGVYT